MEKELLIERLEQIGRSLEQSGHALALLGLGSAGVELDRLDQWSDLDFFVIVEPGKKTNYLSDLTWLQNICPIAYHFPNTADGYKLLFSDGVFCEFAIFEPDELAVVPFSTGRMIWKQPHVSDSIRFSKIKTPEPQPHSQEWLIGEALTNLYVGLCRDQRGEHLSALRFIQHYAVDRLLELIENTEPDQGVRDEFSLERRFEQRHPRSVESLISFMQGIKHNKESAKAILCFLQNHYQINQAICEEIKRLCES